MKYSVVTLDKNHNELTGIAFDDFFKAMSFISNRKESSGSYFQLIDLDTKKIIVRSRMV